VFARTKAVVAICVVLVPTAAVGAVGVPVKAGDASDAGMEPLTVTVLPPEASRMLGVLIPLVNVGAPVPAVLVTISARIVDIVRPLTQKVFWRCSYLSCPPPYFYISCTTSATSAA
jgi:L-lactate permease